MSKTKACWVILGWILLFNVINPDGWAAEGTVYLKNNIHAQQGSRDIKASFANWTSPGAGHIIIPVNTPVVVDSSPSTFRRSVFSMTVQDTKRSVILIEYNEKQMGFNVDEYLKRITSPSPVSLDKLSEIDQKGIKEGKAYPGMTKDGVRIALGYPATHMTPSLDDDRWTYWTNRFKTVVVEFDSKGKVTKAP
ncbi:MAG: outer membrane protein assembly factor BamE [Thermodesulfobacteriota bacterium]